MQCPRCQQDNPVADAEFCPRCGAPAKHAERRTAPAASYADLQRSLSEALEQQTVTAEILRVISSSPTDLQPVMDAVAEKAARVCSAADASIFRIDGDVLRRVAQFGLLPHSMPVILLTREIPTARSVIDRQTIHIADVQSLIETEFPGLRPNLPAQQDLHTVLATPLMREGAPIGAILIRRTHVQPFTDNQVDLLKTFADQAVIAIENVRLFKELEARNRDLTSTSEILRVISRSPTDIQPVLETIAENAGQVCGASDAIVFLVEGARLVRAAHRGPVPITEGSLSLPIDRDSVSGLAVVECRTVHVENILASHEFPRGRAIAERSGFHTAVSVPLVKEGAAVGTLVVRRTEVQAFSSEQIALLETFADQAVIAIENVRLFKELQGRNAELTEALDTQTATSEILRVISSSPTELQPVLDAVAQTAARLCDAKDATIRLPDGDALQVRAHFGPIQVSPRVPINRDSVAGRAVMDRQTLHVRDLSAPEQEPEFPVGRATARRDGVKTFLATPLLREGAAIGVINVRRAEVRPFSERHVELLKTFAAQAVIAIENVRLFKELQEKNSALTEAHAQVTEALEQQTATSEILRVIASSPTDLQPVFDTIAESATRLCEGLFGCVFRYDGELLHVVGLHHFVPDAVVVMRREYPSRPRGLVRPSVIDRTVVHSPDVFSDPRTASPELARTLGFRSYLGVPMLHDGRPIGAISVFRAEAKPFTETQIALLKTFADQAVIAIENVRLFTELEARNRDLTAALEQQTATAEILRVISSSPTDLQPVFDAIVQSAGRLCDAAFGALQLFDGERLTLDAHYGISPEDVAIVQAQVFPLRPDRGSGMGRTILTRAVVHIEDIRSDPEYRVSVVQALEGFRTVLAAPMLRGDVPIGVLSLWRREVRPFSRTQIEMVQTFADQAVIAIENVRLFKELQARNRDLTEALDQQTATSEILQVISSSPTDLQPVLDAIAESAARLCEARDAAILLRDGDQLLPRAHFGPISHAASVPIVRGSVSGRVVIDRETIHVRDLMAVESETEFPVGRAFALQDQFRTTLATPLLREDVAIGAILIRRAEVRPFTDKQIALLKTFADQAVIAIENVRAVHRAAGADAGADPVSRATHGAGRGRAGRELHARSADRAHHHRRSCRRALRDERRCDLRA